MMGYSGKILCLLLPLYEVGIMQFYHSSFLRNSLFITGPVCVYLSREELSDDEL